MLEARIELLKRKLNRLLEEGAGFERVYGLSVRLDKLITRYYIERGKSSRG